MGQLKEKWVIEQAPVALDSASANVQKQHGEPSGPPRMSNALRGARLSALFRAIGIRLRPVFERPPQRGQGFRRRKRPSGSPALHRPVEPP
jgi:hypothetical protein